jgi:branched-subunit amino acid aminotransferase/4-amino-4-deoxychorismate lyase
MLDSQGRLVSVIAGNLYLVRNGELLTPLLCDAGVAGTRRRLVMERWAGRLGLPVREAELTPADVREAEEVFYSNSLYTVRPVAGAYDWVSASSLDPHRVCQALFSVFREELP